MCVACCTLCVVWRVMHVMHCMAWQTMWYAMLAFEKGGRGAGRVFERFLSGRRATAKQIKDFFRPTDCCNNSYGFSGRRSAATNSYISGRRGRRGPWELGPTWCHKLPFGCEVRWVRCSVRRRARHRELCRVPWLRCWIHMMLISTSLQSHAIPEAWKDHCSAHFASERPSLCPFTPV